MSRLVVSAVDLAGRRFRRFCAEENTHKLLNMNTIISLQKYEKSTVYIFLINPNFLKSIFLILREKISKDNQNIK